MMAARNGSVGIIKKLIYYRASVNLTDEVTGLIWWVFVPQLYVWKTAKQEW